MTLEMKPRPRGEIATVRVLNRAIRQAISRSLETVQREGGDDYEWSFICECGCLAWVQRTTAAFDREGAWKDGRRGEACD